MSQNQMPAVQAPPIAQMPPAAQIQEQPPHAIEGLLTYPFYTYTEFWVYVGLGIAVLATFAFFYRRHRLRRAAKKSIHPVLSEFPLISLRKRLEALAPPEPFIGLVQQDYFFRLNMLLREVLEQACGFPATDLTLAELQKPLAEQGHLSQEQREGMLAFFKRSELIKFAAAQSSLLEAQQGHSQALQWCEQLQNRHPEQSEGPPRKAPGDTEEDKHV